MWKYPERMNRLSVNLFFLLFSLLTLIPGSAIAQTAEVVSGTVETSMSQAVNNLATVLTTGEISALKSSEVSVSGTSSAALTATVEAALLAAKNVQAQTTVENAIAVQEKPSAPVTAEAAITVPAQLSTSASTEAPAPSSNENSLNSIMLTPNSGHLLPGEKFDLSKVKVIAKLNNGATKEVAVTWNASTGAIELNVFKAPEGPCVATLIGTFTENGISRSDDIQLKVRKAYREERLIVLYISIILLVIILISINMAVSGKDYFIRKIGGLNAIDEAVGRSTEMGKPVLYITGLYDVSSLPTIASLSILSYVAKKTAEYDTQLLVPCCRSLVMNTAREIVKESYLEAGRPDAYVADNIKYLTDDQFGFVSGVDGIMLREKPAANFYLGHFMAESLIYAETGNSIGAIQIAGTSEFSQIPFFVAACDYCLIGEELFAASAYLSRKPKDVGTLRGQDICKIFIIIVIIAGVTFETLSVFKTPGELRPSWFKSIFQTK